MNTVCLQDHPSSMNCPVCHQEHSSVPSFFTLHTHTSPVHPHSIQLSSLCFLFYVLVLCSLCSVPRFMFRSTFYPVPCFLLCSVQFCSVIQSPCFVFTCRHLCNQCSLLFHLYITALLSEFCVLVLMFHVQVGCLRFCLPHSHV